jgi:hypothetical protein
VGPIEELPEDGGPSLPERGLGDPTVLQTNLTLVLVEAGRRGAEDREVGIDEGLGVRTDRLDRVTREHDQLVDAPGGVPPRAERQRGIAGQDRAERFVVAARRVVDRVVEPEGDLDLGCIDGMRAKLRPAVEALGEVLEGVVVACGSA